MAPWIGIGNSIMKYGSRGLGSSYWNTPNKSDQLFCLPGIVFEENGDTYLRDVTGNNRHFLITGIDWTDDDKVDDVLPFKTFATISAPAGDSELIVADIDNFLYDSGGTPNAITSQMLFQNIDYKDKLFCRYVEHELNYDNTENVYSGVKDITLYANNQTGNDLITCNTYYSVPTKLTSDVIWVSKDGNDGTGNGSEALPYLTIDKAVTTVSSGQTKTIYIKSGDYNEATSGYDYLRLRYLGNTIHFYGLGGVKITSDNATHIIYHEGTGSYTFTRLCLYGTKTNGFSLETGLACGGLNYCETDMTATYGLISGVEPPLYRCKITQYWRARGTTVTDCVLKNKAAYLLNLDGVASKTNVTYCKLIGSDANNVINTVGHLVDFKYNTCYLNSSGAAINLGYSSTTRCDVVFLSNYFKMTGTTLIATTANGAVRLKSLTANYNVIDHPILNTQGTFIEVVNGEALTMYYNTVSSTSKYGFAFVNVVPVADIPCAISIKYNSIETKSTKLSAIINFTESAAYSGSDLVFKGAEIMYNYIIGGLDEYPNETQNVHGILARSGNNMKIAYNYIKGCAIGIVHKNEGVANTEGGVYGNVLVDNRVSIYLRGCHDLKVYGNTAYQSSTNHNSTLMTIDTQIDDCDNCLVENNIFYRNNSPINLNSLFGINAASLAKGTQIRNNITYSPDSDKFIISEGIEYTLAQSLTNGWAVDVVEFDPQITNIRLYPLIPITGATDLGVSFDDGLDISSVWPDAILLKEQGVNWQFGAFVQ